MSTISFCKLYWLQYYQKVSFHILSNFVLLLSMEWASTYTFLAVAQSLKFWHCSKCPFHLSRNHLYIANMLKEKSYINQRGTKIASMRKWRTSSDTCETCLIIMLCWKCRKCRSKTQCSMLLLVPMNTNLVSAQRRLLEELTLKQLKNWQEWNTCNKPMLCCRQDKVFVSNNWKKKLN